MFHKLSVRTREAHITNRMQIIISLTLILTGVAGTVALVLYLALN